MKRRKHKAFFTDEVARVKRARIGAVTCSGKRKTQDATSLYDFTSQLRELTQETRYNLIKSMWEVAYADGQIDPLEDAVIRKTAELLYVDHSDFIRAKLQSQ